VKRTFYGRKVLRTFYIRGYFCCVCDAFSTPLSVFVYVPHYESLYDGISMMHAIQTDLMLVVVVVVVV
jgi:hypothetical protein